MNLCSCGQSNWQQPAVVVMVVGVCSSNASLSIVHINPSHSFEKFLNVLECLCFTIHRSKSQCNVVQLVE